MSAESLDNDEPADLSQSEREAVEQRRSPPARVVHEVIRQQGIEELERPVASLLWSGTAAGVTIWLSLISQAALTVRLPDSPWRDAIASLGYSVGFVLCTGLLHISGIGVGLLNDRPGGIVVTRSMGALIAVAGLWFLAKALGVL